MGLTPTPRSRSGSRSKARRRLGSPVGFVRGAAVGVGLKSEERGSGGSRVAGARVSKHSPPTRLSSLPHLSPLTATVMLTLTVTAAPQIMDTLTGVADGMGMGAGMDMGMIRTRRARRIGPVSRRVLPVLACAALAAACKGSAQASSSKPPVAASVVVHTLASASDEPRNLFRTTPPDPSTPPPPGTSVNGILTAQSFGGTPDVGALFLDAGEVASIHFCTASVVHSAGGDLIITAAHCVYNTMYNGFLNHILFVPGYHDDVAPYGTWVATTAILDSRWIASEDPDADVAFLKVRRVVGDDAGDTGGGASAGLESSTGANAFQAAPGYTAKVNVVGYPLTASRPVSCTTTTSEQSASQLRFGCANFPNGTSGAPFATADGFVVGVLGGYQQGGNSPDVSYAAYFDAPVAALYRTASAP